MAKINKNTQTVFFTLLKAGLWEQSAQLLPFAKIDYSELYDIADGQSVVGLIAAGLDNVEDTKILKRDARPFLVKVFSLESRNAEMNNFIGSLVEDLRRVGIFSLLVKGQGIAQCYSRPLWRSFGDIDLLLNEEYYERAKAFLIPKASSVDEEIVRSKHLGMKFADWTVELHGSLHNQVSRRANSTMDMVQKDALEQGGVRVWRNGETDVILPSPDNDVIIIFSHILQHFFRGGIGLRQICDWCRLLWNYREAIDCQLLEARVKRMGLMSEWKAFAAYAVKNLGLSTEAMPLYDSAPRWERKAELINSHILKVGNFGHNRDSSFYDKYPYLVIKAISLSRHIGDFFCCLRIFPVDSVRVFGRVIRDGIVALARGR